MGFTFGRPGGRPEKYLPYSPYLILPYLTVPYLTIYVTFYLTLHYLTLLLTFYLTFDLTFYLAFYLTLPYFTLPFFPGEAGGPGFSLSVSQGSLRD